MPDPMALFFGDCAEGWEAYFSLCEGVENARLLIYFVKCHEPSILGANTSTIRDVVVERA
ncbi:hypothetical protein MA16_Dca015156 [Dendrobium catenatum]|uniref:Uncharacterized protein n=1 Tax=Dendrobium catenatum TaxID=906689 RepID=A0A2I0X4B0_9ASPA|nr:hypothetical protein MA16_Dca015156 [Dendrobium catenatum]